MKVPTSSRTPAISEMSSDEEDNFNTAIFQEPDNYFQPEKPYTYTDYTLLSGQKLHVRLIGHNPLWVLYARPTLSFFAASVTNLSSRATTSGTAVKSYPPTSNSTPIK